MKWEYLRVEIRGGMSGEYHSAPNSIQIIGDDGKPISWDKVKGENSHLPAVSRLLKKLGGDGWELTGVVPTGSIGQYVVLYFKRPKP